MRKSLVAVLILPFLCFAQEKARQEQKDATEAKPQSKATAKAGKLKLIDLNTATEAELQQLPGVDAAMAKKIIANRPYITVEDLARSGIPVEVERNARMRVTVTPQTGGKSAAGDPQKTRGSAERTKENKSKKAEKNKKDDNKDQ